MAQNFAQAFGYKLYFQLIKAPLVDLNTLALGGIGVGKFMDISTLLSNNAIVSKVGTGATMSIIAGESKAITKASIVGTVATLTFAAATGFVVGKPFAVQGLAAPFAALNGTFTATAVTTVSPFTVTFTTAAPPQAEAAVTAGAASSVLKLDGTDPPIRLLGLSNAAPNEGESEETVQTYDDEAQSYDTSIATAKSFSMALSGLTDHADAAYKLMRIASKESVREKLMIKYARVGPTGVGETTFGFGRFTGFEESPEAGTIVKYSNTIRAYGPYGLDF
jgi:hypothetical protein